MPFKDMNINILSGRYKSYLDELWTRSWKFHASEQDAAAFFVFVFEMKLFEVFSPYLCPDKTWFQSAVDRQTSFATTNFLSLLRMMLEALRKKRRQGSRQLV